MTHYQQEPVLVELHNPHFAIADAEKVEIVLADRAQDAINS